MHIGIDGNEANVPHKVGVSMYTLQILRYYAATSSETTQFTVYLRKPPRPELPPPSAFFRYRVVPGPVLWVILFLPMRLFWERLTGKAPGVFFSPAHYIPAWAPCPVVVTIHDLSYELYPQEFLKRDLFQLKNWTPSSVKHANHVIAVSQTTKKDLLRWYRVPESKVSVVYNGYNRPQPESTATPPFSDNPWGLKPQSYLLTVGTVQPRKNIGALIRAFDQIADQHPNLVLIIAGKPGWLAETIYNAVPRRLEKRIIFTGYVEDAMLAQLYVHALIFTLPSLYEGFGIPLLEAFYYGVAVAASQSSSIPEIGQEAVAYFDPLDHTHMAQTLNSLIQDPNKRALLIAKGKEVMAQFSWERCAQNTLTILQSSYV